MQICGGYLGTIIIASILLDDGNLVTFRWNEQQDINFAYGCHGREVFIQEVALWETQIHNVLKSLGCTMNCKAFLHTYHQVIN